MPDPEVLKRVKAVIGRVLEVDPDSIADDANFVFDLGASSMQSVQLVAAFEEEFGIEMAEDEALQVQDVHGAAEFIASIMAK